MPNIPVKVLESCTLDRAIQSAFPSQASTEDSPLKQTRIAELVPPALDWAVAKALDLKVTKQLDRRFSLSNGWCLSGDITFVTNQAIRLENEPLERMDFSSNQVLGASLIEREKISTTIDDSGVWIAFNKYNYAGEERFMQSGETHLIAAMRCFVTSKLGPTLEVPRELLPEPSNRKTLKP